MNVFFCFSYLSSFFLFSSFFLALVHKKEKKCLPSSRSTLLQADRSSFLPFWRPFSFRALSRGTSRPLLAWRWWVVGDLLLLSVWRIGLGSTRRYFLHFTHVFFCFWFFFLIFLYIPSLPLIDPKVPLPFSPLLTPVYPVFSNVEVFCSLFTVFFTAFSH